MDSAKIITVRDNVVQDLAGVALRQGIIGLMSWLLPRAFAEGVAEGVAALSIIAGTALYGWVRTYRRKRAAVALAHDAKIGRVTK